ncbi:hypothetical protein Tco_1577176 [Tanacetum coccineum]
MTCSDEGLSLGTKQPLTKETAHDKVKRDIYERVLMLQESRPIIEMHKNSDQHKKLLDNILLDKLNLDEEIEEGEEEATKEVIRNYKTLREKNNPGVFVIPIRVEGKYDTHALVDTRSNINVLPYGIYMQIGAGEVEAIADKIRMADPPPPQAQTEQVNAVFTGSGKSDDTPKFQKDPPPPMIVLGMCRERSFPTPVHCFGHNSVIRTPFDAILAATRASKNNMNDDRPMCERHEANYIRSEDYQNRNSHNSFSHQSLHVPNDPEKSLTELNNDVKNDLEDFKRWYTCPSVVFLVKISISSIINLKLAKHTSLDHSRAVPMGILRDVLCQVGVTTILERFLVLIIRVDKDVPIVMRRRFLYTRGGIINTIKGATSTFDGICHQQFPIATIKAKTEEENSDSEKAIFESRDKDGKPIYGPDYLENDSSVSNPLDTLNPFRKICIWKKIVAFLGSLPVPLQNNDWMTKYAKSSYRKVEEDGTWHFKCSIVDPEGNEYNNGFQTKTTERELSKPCKLSDIILLNEMGCGEEIEEILEIKHLGLYENEDVISEGFESYFIGGLRSDDNFNAMEYWLRISSDDDLQLSWSHAAKIKKPVLRVLQKMIS